MIESKKSAKNIGVQHYVNSIGEKSFYQLRNIILIKQFLSQEKDHLVQPSLQQEREKQTFHVIFGNTFNRNKMKVSYSS